MFDLFLNTPQLNKDVKLCSTLVQENVRSDHIAVLLDLEDNLEQNKIEEEKFFIKGTDFEQWKQTTLIEFNNGWIIT